MQKTEITILLNHPFINQACPKEILKKLALNLNESDGDKKINVGPYSSSRVDRAVIPNRQELNDLDYIVVSNQKVSISSPLLVCNGDVPGFELTTASLSPNEENILMDMIDKQSWMNDHEFKRVQIYGYNYLNSSVASVPIPEFLLPMILKLNQSYGIDFNHVIISEYLPGIGLQPHIDRFYWGEIIIGISLLSDCKMTLSKLSPENNHSVNIDLPPRSLYLLSGDARYKYTHGIQSDYISSRRVSITARSMSKQKVILSPEEINLLDIQ